MNEILEKYFLLYPEQPADYLWIAAALLMGVALIIQLHYILGVYRRVIRYRKKDVKSETGPVSVIICARNEAQNLRKNLPLVLNQFYPDFEVIVVNDGSTDETAEVLSEFKSRYPHLYVTGIEHREGYTGGKKLAQTIGIKAAHHDQLVFTDADCRPASPNWIRQMQSNFLKQTEIVLGYGGYNANKGFLNQWVRTDTVYIAMQYLGFALNKQAYMGVGRNLAYRRELFFRNKGHASHLHIASGDDDLFINETTNSFNTVVEIHPESFTWSEPVGSWKAYFRQKRRHLTTSWHYHRSNQMRLAAELASRGLFYCSCLALLVSGYLPGVALAGLLIRSLTFLLIFKLVMRRLTERNLLLISLLYELFWPLMAGYLTLTTRNQKKKRTWK